MPTMPAMPTMNPVPQAYTPQNWSGSFNPWSGQGASQTAGSQNPYAAGISSIQNQATGYANSYSQQAPQMQAGINQGQQGMQQFSQNSSAYPSYPNIAGAGSQTAGVAIPQYTPPKMMGSGDNGAGSQMTTTDTSHGFNPWSLTGEAMTRSN
jgi:hypothetical protein